MSYLVFARKYRPDTFESVSGQEHVTKTLANSIIRNKVGHAYLFTGPRGVGKTSVARIFAKALNCKEGPTATPCLKCRNCQEISQGISLAVREIDGASHNSVDNVRELIESFRSLPAPGSHYKIYIIDEVHMLSIAAFNALLKSLEEPPPNTVFILATTEAHKIPETVISRCQRHDFRSLNADDLETRLRFIASKENLAIEPEALRMIARLSDGSMRDAQSLLDRMHAFCDGTITAEGTSKVLGSVHRSILFDISEAIFSRDYAKALDVLSSAFSYGIDSGLFLKEFVSHWRDLLVIKYNPKKTSIGLLDEEATLLERQVNSVDGTRIQNLFHMAISGADMALRSSYPKYAIESLLVRMATDEGATTQENLKDNNASNVSNSRVKEEVVVKTNAIQPQKKHKDMPKEEARGAPSIREEDWASFVRFSAESNARMLCEQLKRISVEKIGEGVFSAKGPEFSIGYLQIKENKEKFIDLLRKFFKIKDWSIKLSIGDGDKETLLERENFVRENRVLEEKENISNHPKIKSLKQFFPGSNIENIRTKE